MVVVVVVWTLDMEEFYILSFCSYFCVNNL